MTSTRAFGNGYLARLLGNVVVIALESALGDADPLSERVQFVEACVTDHVTPQQVAPRPHAVVDEDRHRYARSPLVSRSRASVRTSVFLQNAHRTYGAPIVGSSQKT